MARAGHGDGYRDDLAQDLADAEIALQGRANRLVILDDDAGGVFPRGRPFRHGDGELADQVCAQRQIDGLLRIVEPEGGAAGRLTPEARLGAAVDAGVDIGGVGDEAIGLGADVGQGEGERL